MKYQLVLQIPTSSLKDYDVIVELEEKMIRQMGSSASLDGHDAGSGEMNIFILTDHPKTTFEQIQPLIAASDLISELKAAFREVGRDQYTTIYPTNLKGFAVA